MRSGGRRVLAAESGRVTRPHGPKSNRDEGESSFDLDPSGTNDQSHMSIAYFSSAEPELEAYGVELVNWASRHCRSIDFPHLGFIPAGPALITRSRPSCFCGHWQVGYGPLHVGSGTLDL